jgi:uncharacterized protein
VNWFPWGGEAIETARRLDLPIFLSIGYSACHWCHVMERESFENDEIAAYLNEHFVSIKVDREERPDLDDIYMKAVQVISGSGGWPMSVFLTPDLEPFFGGTYFPPHDMAGRAGFPTVLRAVTDAWERRRGDVTASVPKVLEAMGRFDTAGAGPGARLSARLLDGAVRDLLADFDPVHGGSLGAPKFPSAPTVSLLLRQAARTGDASARHAALHTLRQMALGGIHDHIGGGFHRYSVDERWLVPHFEKMLYDNAQLAEVYLEAFQLTGDTFFRQVAADILDYTLRDLAHAPGGFYSTEDADSGGEEGMFYVWTDREILGLLGEADGSLFCNCYNVRHGGNFASHEPFHMDMNILHLEKPVDEIADELGMRPGELEDRLADMRARLAGARATRVRPGLDDKLLASWNGLQLTALARGYQVLGDPRYRDAAVALARFVLDEMRRDGVLLRTHRAGRSQLPGYLDDYAFFINGLADLYEADFDPAWLTEARALADTLLGHFQDTANGGFYFTSESLHEKLPLRPKPVFDGSEPSGNAMAALALVRLGRLTGGDTFARAAERTLDTLTGGMSAAPRAHTKALCALDAWLHPGPEIALCGPANDDTVAGFLRAVHGRYFPNKSLALLDPAANDPETLGKAIPLLADKARPDGRPAAYVCENYTCKEPVFDADALDKALGG